MFKALIVLLTVALIGATPSPAPQSTLVTRAASGPIIDNGSYAKSPNIVKLRIRKRGCRSTKCERVYQSHNDRVDVGAQYVANQISNTASVGTAVAQFIALSSDAAAVVKTDTVCPSELTTNGMGRKIATFAYTTPPSILGGAATYTLSNSYNATGSYTINKLCLFTLISAGTMLFETRLGAAVSGGNGDTINVTWTVNV